ncbi:NADH dehydrogenase [ubiquinone] 1 alpha subcomplex subunit 7 [Copidosoma floridanum]|uniref:NADH dehydrogenase [ubiquinone] 1 alpha subcomplex subunit 7 n=1 Tax=Copidosoma floridanum TaxID=29053 RepID=UPI0006C992D6|nr:NADH dehydrogenase [ubiquinone] 1 alpha subcomplex subunit 7 [Copidosoma floridanum]
MSSNMSHRSVTPIINFLRTLLRGKPLRLNSLRYADEIAARTQPQPMIPAGPYGRVTKIYYFPRDSRRKVEPPISVVKSQALFERKSQPEYLTPGKVYQPR